MKKNIILLLVIALFNCISKTFFIYDSSIWCDEAEAISYAVQPISNITDISKNVAIPPLYYYTLHYWNNIFGISAFSSRSLSVIFSILTTILVFLFTQKYFNRESALLASIFFLLSNINLYYAQEARPYSMVVFLSLCSFYLFFEFLKNPTILKTVGLAVISFLLIFTHYIAVFIPVVQGIAVIGMEIKCHLGKSPFFPFRGLRGGDFPPKADPPLAEGAGDKKNKNILRFFIFAMVLTFLMFAPWFKYVMKNFTIVGDTWLAPPTISQFKWVFIEFAGNKVLAFMFIALAVFSVGYLVYEYFSMPPKEPNSFNAESAEQAQRAQRKYLKFFANSAVSFASFAGKKINLKYLTILLLWAVLPVILAYIISQFNPVFYPRYFLYSSVGLYLFLSYLFSAVKIKTLYKILIFAPIPIYSAFTLDLSPSKGEDWKNAVPEIKKEMETTPSPFGEGRGGAAVIISAWYQYRPFTYYYNREYFRDYENTIELLKKDNVHCIDNENGLANIQLEPYSKIILIQSHQPVADPENTLFKYFNEKYNTVGGNDYEGIKVTVFGKK